MRCHASSQKELTFSALHHLDGKNYNPLPYQEYQSLIKTVQKLGLTDEYFAPTLPPYHANILGDNSTFSLADSNINSQQKAINQTFAAAYSNFSHLHTSDSSAAKFTLPGVTHDHVPAAQVAQEFATSDQCMGCHDSDRSPFGVTPKTPLGNMVSAETASQTQIEMNGKKVGLKNTSPYGEWRWSMMGLAGRDPIFFCATRNRNSKIKLYRHSRHLLKLPRRHGTTPNEI